MTAHHALTGGFTNEPIDAANAFRKIMRAIACPGEIQTLGEIDPPVGLSQAAATLILTLCDHETPVFLAPELRTSAIEDWITFHTNAPFSDSDSAQFAVGSWRALRDLTYPLGSAEYPDQSTTLIVETDKIEATGATLKGPGIQDKRQLSLIETAFFQENAKLFPRGLDFFFTSGKRLAALPRTTKVS